MLWAVAVRASILTSGHPGREALDRAIRGAVAGYGSLVGGVRVTCDGTRELRVAAVVEAPSDRIAGMIAPAVAAAGVDDARVVVVPYVAATHGALTTWETGAATRTATAQACALPGQPVDPMWPGGTVDPSVGGAAGDIVRAGTRAATSIGWAVAPVAVAVVAVAVAYVIATSSGTRRTSGARRRYTSSRRRR